jgi:hypothetical protein
VLQSEADWDRIRDVLRALVQASYGTSEGAAARA